MAERAVEAVLFDVNETLFSMQPLGRVFGEVGLDPAAVPLWFARLLRDGFALAAMGGYRPFAELAADALYGLDPQLEQEQVARVLAGFRQLAPHPDVEAGLRLLQDAALPAVTLTNSSAEVVQGLLERAGLAGYMQANLSVEQVGRWKPAPQPYQAAATQLGVEPGGLALVAAHPWDCAGAQAAGLRSGWVNRTGAAWPRVYPAPTVAGQDLPGVLTALLEG
jgi:2-haloacid dehalogenase